MIAAAKNLMLENNFETPQSLATAIVEKYIRLPRADGESVVTMCDDGVLLYASEVLSGIIVVWIPRRHSRRGW